MTNTFKLINSFILILHFNTRFNTNGLFRSLMLIALILTRYCCTYIHDKTAVLLSVLESTLYSLPLSPRSLIISDCETFKLFSRVQTVCGL